MFRRDLRRAMVARITIKTRPTTPARPNTAPESGLFFKNGTELCVGATDELAGSAVLAALTTEVMVMTWPSEDVR